MRGRDDARRTMAPPRQGRASRRKPRSRAVQVPSLSCTFWFSTQPHYKNQSRKKVKSSSWINSTIDRDSRATKAKYKNEQETVWLSRVLFDLKCVSAHRPHDALPRRGTARVTRTRVHARAYRGSAKVPFPERGSVTDGRTAASLTSCTVRWRAPSSALAWRMRRARSVSSPPTSHRARMRHRVSSHFSRFSEAPSRLGPRSVGLDRRGDAIEPESEPSRPFSKIGESQPRADPRALASGRGGARLESARATLATTPNNHHSARTAAHRPFPPSSRRRLARLVPCPLPDDRLERARNTHPRFFRVKIHHRVSETNRIPITPRASSTSTRPRRAVGNARASLSSRRSWYSVWTTPLGSTRSSF
jgi:hypothetical protein